MILSRPQERDRGRAVVFISTGLFAAITAWVMFGNAESIDEPIAAIFIHARLPWLTSAATALTWLGSALFTGVVTIIASLLLGRVQGKLVAARPLLAWIATWSLTNLTKLAMHRARPRREEWLARPWGDSFPSQHATLITCLTLVLWRFYAPRLSKEGRAVFACATATVVFLVATTRIYLGVHYLSDVVAGILLGAAVGSLVPST